MMVKPKTAIKKYSGALKANEIFEESITEDLRDIYIKNRYGEKGTDKIEVDKMKNLYKKL